MKRFATRATGKERHPWVSLARECPRGGISANLSPFAAGSVGEAQTSALLALEPRFFGTAPLASRQPNGNTIATETR